MKSHRYYCFCQEQKKTVFIPIEKYYSFTIHCTGSNFIFSYLLFVFMFIVTSEVKSFKQQLKVILLSKQRYLTMLPQIMMLL